MKTTSLFVPLLTAAFVSAHGFLSSVHINGVVFPGNAPRSLKLPQIPSVIRQIDFVDPNKGADNPALNCGPGATPGVKVAQANPGDRIDFFWAGEDSQHRVCRFHLWSFLFGTDSCVFQVDTQYRTHADLHG